MDCWGGSVRETQRAQVLQRGDTGAEPFKSGLEAALEPALVQVGITVGLMLQTQEGGDTNKLLLGFSSLNL